MAVEDLPEPAATAGASSAHSKRCRAMLRAPELREAFGVGPDCWRFRFKALMRSDLWKWKFSMNLTAGSVNPCAPLLARANSGAHGVTRPANAAGLWFRSSALRQGFILLPAAARNVKCPGQLLESVTSAVSLVLQPTCCLMCISKARCTTIAPRRLESQRYQ